MVELAIGGALLLLVMSRRQQAQQDPPPPPPAADKSPLDIVLENAPAIGGALGLGGAAAGGGGAAVAGGGATAAGGSTATAAAGISTGAVVGLAAGALLIAGGIASAVIGFLEGQELAGASFNAMKWYFVDRPRELFHQGLTASAAYEQTERENARNYLAWMKEPRGLLIFSDQDHLSYGLEHGKCYGLMLEGQEGRLKVWLPSRQAWGVYNFKNDQDVPEALLKEPWRLVVRLGMAGAGGFQVDLTPQWEEFARANGMVIGPPGSEVVASMPPTDIGQTAPSTGGGTTYVPPPPAPTTTTTNTYGATTTTSTIRKVTTQVL